MIRFEKVSLDQYEADRLPMLLAEGLTEEEGRQKVREEYDHIIMPRRATAMSAGYDLHTPYDLVLAPGKETVIPTGLRVQMEADMWMGVYIRSSLGFKYGVRLNNSVSVIDADYYGAANEGHLKTGLYNHGTKDLVLKAGDAFGQGIFQRYFLTADDEPVTEKRTGGFGSTNRQ